MAMVLGNLSFYLVISLFIDQNNIYFEKSDNCTLNNVKFGDYQCSVKSCKKTWIQCETSDAYSVYKINNLGYDNSSL